MLARIQMELRSEDQESITVNQSSLFQGALMELVDSDYTKILHLSGLKPYSQYVLYDKNQGINRWIIQTLNQEAYENIIVPVKKNVGSAITLNHNHKSYLVSAVKEEKLDKAELVNGFYTRDSEKRFCINFLTPTAFKKDGRYVFYPDIRCIFQSLMNKYDAADAEECWRNEETLDQLVSSCAISQYRLKSTNFCLEGIRIPAFVGSLTLKIYGSQTMANFADMMFRFGTYSGVGIKSAIGMGAIQLLKRGEKG